MSNISIQLQIYKIPDGKPENEFAFNGEAKNSTFATEIVNETHRFWQSLISKEVTSDKISWYVNQEQQQRQISVFGNNLGSTLVSFTLVLLQCKYNCC